MNIYIHTYTHKYTYIFRVSILSCRNTRGTCEKREIAWEHEHQVRVFPRNFKFLTRSPNVAINSTKARKMFSISFIK